MSIIKECIYDDNIAGNYLYCLNPFQLASKTKHIILPDEVDQWWHNNYEK